MNHLRDWYRGASCFLLCPGPSLADSVREFDFSARGILTCAVNGAALVHRPHLWVCCDSPDRFHDRIWRDPGIRKFVPTEIACRTLRRQHAGKIEKWDRKALDCPGTVAYPREFVFDHETWLTHERIMSGPMPGTACSLGIFGGRSVMFGALQILFLLGVRTVYLVGADFRMIAEKPYAVNEPRHEGQIKDNNDLFRTIDRRLAAALPIARERHGFTVYNSTPGSSLTSASHFPLRFAIQEATSHWQSDTVTEGWYYPQSAMMEAQA